KSLLKKFIVISNISNDQDSSNNKRGINTDCFHQSSIKKLLFPAIKMAITITKPRKSPKPIPNKRSVPVSPVFFKISTIRLLIIAPTINVMANKLTIATVIRTEGVLIQLVIKDDNFSENRKEITKANIQLINDNTSLAKPRL